MKKPSLTLLFLALALVGGVAFLLTQGGDGAGEPTPGLEPVTQGEAAQHRPAGDLPTIAGAGDSRDLAPRVNEELARNLPEEIRDGVGALSEGRPDFTGRIVGPDGAPVQGASVSVGRDWGPMAMWRQGSDEEGSSTDVTGSFRAKWVSSRDLRVSVKASGFAPLNQRVERPVGEDGMDLGTFTLEHGVILRGIVLDFRGNPVQDAGVSLQPADEDFGWTLPSDYAEDEPDVRSGVDGSFELDSVAVGPWAIKVHHALHPGVRVGGVSEFTGVHSERVFVELPEGGSLSGYVEGVEADLKCVVVADRLEYRDMMDPNLHRSASIGADGHFEFSGLLLEQDYELTVQKGSDQVGFFGEALSESVTARVGQAGVVLVMKGPAGLSFRVLSRETGTPIEDFKAKAGSWWLEELEDADGRVVTHHPGGRAHFPQIDNVTEAEGVSLHIAAEGYSDHDQKEIQLVRGEVLDLGDIALEPAPILRVRVVADASSEPVKGARVKLSAPTPQTSRGNVIFGAASEGDVFEGPERQESRSGKTDAEGWVSLTTIPQVACTLKAQHGRYADLILPAVEYEGGEVEMRMLSGGLVRVRVLGADGAPAPDTEVSHRLRGASRTEGTYDSKDTSSKGEVVFRHLKAGIHSFCLREDRSPGAFMVFEGMEDGESPDEEAWVSLEVTEGSESEVSLHQAARGVLYGRVTEGGRALAGATLRLEPFSGEGDEAEAMRMQRRQMIFFGGRGGVRTKGDGSYRMDETTVGEYELVVSHASRAMDGYFRVTLTPGENEFHVDLPSTIIEGIVVDKKGRPVEGARVVVQRPGQSGFRHGMAMIMSSTGGSQFTLGSGHGDGSLTTDASGQFRVKGVAAGCELELEVSGGSYQTETVEIDPLRPDEIRAGLHVVLTEGGNLEATMLMADGRPVEFGTLALRQLLEGEEEGETRHAGVQNGAVMVEGLTPGEWWATATAYDLGSLGQGLEDETMEQEQAVHVKPGEVTEILFQF